MDLGLKGKVVLVTGGARDVGGEISRFLAAEGAVVAVNFNKSEGEALSVVRQVADAGGVSNMPWR